MSLTKKKKFLIVLEEDKERRLLADRVSNHIAHASFHFAQDGRDALNKINNDPPHIVIIGDQLTKPSALEVVSWILDDKLFKGVAIIILSNIPDKEHFVDEIVLGRVQFLHEPENDLELAKALSRALNFLSSDKGQQFNLRFLAPGEVLMRQGEAADYVYIVRRGQLQAVLDLPDKRIPLGIIVEGEFVGEMAYINGEPRSADVIADSDCELIQIPVNLLDNVLFQKPAWSQALMKTLSKRVKQANQHRV